MSSNVEERVVEMQFDNAQFEQNAKSTIKTLNALEKSLDLKGSTKAFEELDRAAKSVDISSIGVAVDSVINKFSILGTIGDQVLRNLTTKALDLAAKWLTAIPRQAYTGGKTRALNIEQAKFQLAGLGIAWEDIYDNIDKAVSGTAYGLDEAAKIASQLAASGIAYGDAESDMAHALRGISGVAAMTNSSYQEIGDIFATIGGQGKVMTFQLRQLESRGLNAAAQLGKILGKTEQEVRDMVSKGQLDFKTFAKAMDDAFGEHATKANETFTGAFSNMKAAISRIGADFATPIMEAARRVFNALRETFNGIRKLTRPFAEKQFTEWLMSLSDSAVATIGKWSKALAKSEEVVRKFFGLEKIQIVKPKDLKNLQQLGTELDVLDNGARGAKQSFINLKKIFAGFEAVGDIAKMAFSAIGKELKKFMPDWGKVAEKILEVGGRLGDWAVRLRDSIKENDTFNKAFLKLEEVLSKVFSKLSEGASKAKIVLSKLAIYFRSVKESISTFLKAFLDVEDGKTIWSKFGDWFSIAADRISKIFASLLVSIKSLGNWKQIFANLLNSLSAAWNRILPILSSFKDKLMDLFGGKGFGPKIFSYAGALLAAFLGFRKLKATETSIRRFKDALSALFGSFKNLYTDIPGKISWVLGQVGTSLRSFSDNLKVDSLKKIATAILILAIGLAVLAAIDGDKLGGALAAAAAGIGMLVGAFKLLNGKDALSFKQTYLSGSQYTNLIKLSVAVLIIAFAIKALSKAVERLGAMDVDNLRNGLIGVIGLLGAIGAVSQMIPKNTGLGPRVGIGVIAMAAGILMLVRAVEKLGKMNIDQLRNGLISVIGLLGAIAAMSQMMGKKSAISPKFGVGVIAMAAGILILVKAVAQLGALDSQGVLTSGIMALAAIMGMITIMGVVLKDTKNILSIGVAMIAFGIALRIMVKALSVISELGDIYTPLTAIAFLLTMIAAFSAVVSNGVKNIGSISLAMIGFSVALVIFAAAMKILASMSWEGIIKGLAAIAWAFVILGVAAFALGGLLPVMLGLAGALAVVGVAVFLVAAGAALLAAAFVVLGSAGAAAAAGFIASLQIIAVGLLSVAGVLGQGIALLVTGLIVTLAESAGIIARAFADLIISLLGTLKDSVPEIVKGIAELLVNVFQSLGDYAPQILDGALGMIEKVLAGLAKSLGTHSGAIFSAVSDILVTLIDGILGIITGILGSIAGAAGDLLGAIGGAIGEIVGEVIGGLVEGISSHFDEIAGNMDSFLEALSPFVERLNSLNIDEGKIQALKAIAEAILALTEAKLLDGLSNFANFFTGGRNSFSEFATEIASMGPAMALYSSSVSGIDTDAIIASSDAIQALSDVAKHLGRSGGLLSLALGKPKTLNTFASELVASIPGIKAFAEAAPTIAQNADAMKNVANVIDSIVEVANKLNPEHKELLWGAYVEDAQSLGEFMQQFSDTLGQDGKIMEKGIASNLVDFSKTMEEIDLSKIQTGADVMTALVELAEPLQGKQQVFSIFGADVWKSETTNGLENLLAGVSAATPLIKKAMEDFDPTSMERLGSFVANLTPMVESESILRSLGANPGGAILEFATGLDRSVDKIMEISQGISDEINLTPIDNLIAWAANVSDTISSIGPIAIDKMVTGMQQTATLKGTNTAAGIAKTIANKLRSFNSEFKSLGAFLAEGYVQGILSKTGSAFGAGKSLVNSTKNGIEAFAEIQSPSKMARRLGEYFGEGYVIGVKDWFHNSELAGKDLASSTIIAASSALDYIHQLLDDDVGIDMSIRPVLDLSDIRMGMTTLDSMFSQRQALAAEIEADSLGRNDEVEALLDVGWRILGEIQNGRDIYLDGKVLAGSMNRRLGRMEGL